MLSPPPADGKVELFTRANRKCLHALRRCRLAEQRMMCVSVWRPGTDRDLMVGAWGVAAVRVPGLLFLGRFLPSVAPRLAVGGRRPSAVGRRPSAERGERLGLASDTTRVKISNRVAVTAGLQFRFTGPV